jgi:hypothetical protein
MKFKELLSAIFIFGLMLIILIFFSGTQIYEMLLIPIALFFYLIGKSLSQLVGVKEDRLLELLFSISNRIFFGNASMDSNIREIT